MPFIFESLSRTDTRPGFADRSKSDPERGRRPADHEGGRFIRTAEGNHFTRACETAAIYRAARYKLINMYAEYSPRAFSGRYQTRRGNVSDRKARNACRRACHEAAKPRQRRARNSDPMRLRRKPGLVGKRQNSISRSVLCNYGEEDNILYNQIIL